MKNLHRYPEIPASIHGLRRGLWSGIKRNSSPTVRRWRHSQSGIRKRDSNSNQVWGREEYLRLLAGPLPTFSPVTSLNSSEYNDRDFGIKWIIYSNSFRGNQIVGKNSQILVLVRWPVCKRFWWITICTHEFPGVKKLCVGLWRQGTRPLVIVGGYDDPSSGPGPRSDLYLASSAAGLSTPTAGPHAGAFRGTFI